MGELAQGKIVQSSNDFFCGQNLRKFEICISWRFSRLEMFKISRFFTKTVGAKKQSYENKTFLIIIIIYNHTEETLHTILYLH